MTALPENEIFEVEQKIQVKELTDAIKFFEGQNAIFNNTSHIQDFYYDTTTRTLFRQGRVLKLRITTSVRPNKGETVLSMTVKTQTKLRDVRNEIEIPIDELSKAQRFISLLGFTEIAQVNKVRSEYCLGHVKILFDAGNLGNFIEIEILSSNPETSSIKIQEIIDILPFPYEKQSLSYLQLALEYNREKNKSGKEKRK